MDRIIDEQSIGVAALSLVNPKVPTGPLWIKADWWLMPKALAELGYPAIAYFHQSTDLFVISAVEVVSEPGQPELGPEYHLSISRMGVRCTTAEALFVLYSFGLLDAKEDNHVPSGKVRNFWRPVNDNLAGYECKCVESEPAMVEDKGDFVWRGITK